MIEYYSAPKKGDILLCAMAVHEISQAQKNKYWLISCTCGF